MTTTINFAPILAAMNVYAQKYGPAAAAAIFYQQFNMADTEYGVLCEGMEEWQWEDINYMDKALGVLAQEFRSAALRGDKDHAIRCLLWDAVDNNLDLFGIHEKLLKTNRGRQCLNDYHESFLRTAEECDYKFALL